MTNGTKQIEEPRKRRQGTPDSLDDILGPEGGYGEEDDFVVDDDGAGYALGLNQNGKRGYGDLDSELAPLSKRRAGDATWDVTVHPAIQPGSTPWRGNRRYLCRPIADRGSSIMLIRYRSESDRIRLDRRPRYSPYRDSRIPRS